MQKQGNLKKTTAASAEKSGKSSAEKSAKSGKDERATAEETKHKEQLQAVNELMQDIKEERSSHTPASALLNNPNNATTTPIKKPSQETERKSMNKREKKLASKQQQGHQLTGRGSEIKTENKTSQQASDHDDNGLEKTETKRKDSVNKQSVAKAAKKTAIEQSAMSTKKELFPATEAVEEAPKPTMMEQIDKIDGACEYFYVLQKENEKIKESMPKPAIPQANQKGPTKEQLLAHSIQAAQLHEMPRGFPQKHMYKHPKIDPVKFQIEVDHEMYKGGKEAYYQANEQQHLLVYQDQKHEVPHPPPAQQAHARPSNIKRKKRSNSFTLQTLRFRDPGSLLDEGKEEEDEQPRKFQRKDEIKAPMALNCEPVSQHDQEKYKPEDLDDYLDFCSFVMRSAPVQGNYCGIWLRGSHMYKEKAFKLLNMYHYNFDLAKFHILYPSVMADPDKKNQIIQVAKENPNDFAKEVANAVIDLQGCKQDEIDSILNKFRFDLSNRINEDQLRYHLTALEKIRVPTPPDIEDKIKKSIEFSREIKKKCNIQAGSTKSAQHIPVDKKLRMSELIELYEQQKSFSYITQEMIILQQQLDKAKQWQQRVESLREMELVQFKAIDQIYVDGKNIPVNFQELMVEVKQKKIQAEDLNNRIQDAIIVRKTRMRAGESKKASGRSSSNHQPGLPISTALASKQPDKEQQMRNLLVEAKQMKLQSDHITKLQNKVSDIDKWKHEVQNLFKNYREEMTNYKRYRDHYKSLLARSSVFQIELALMRDLQRKCSFIDWRDKVEEIVEKLSKNERVTLEQIQTVLEEGTEKGFLNKAKGCYEVIESQQPDIDEEGAEDTTQQLESPAAATTALFQNFQHLVQMIQTYEDAQKFDKELLKVLNKINNKTPENSELETPLDQDQDKESEATPEDTIETLQRLRELELQGTQIKVEVEQMKEFKTKLAEVKAAEEHCCNLISDNTDENREFKITSQNILNQFLQARSVFQNLNIVSDKFTQFQAQIMPYIFWTNKAVKIIRAYHRALGLKQNQLNLYDFIDESSNSIRYSPDLRNLVNPYEKESSYHSMLALTADLQTPKFQFLNESEEGKYIKQIEEKTESLKEEFATQKNEKRNESFDINKYFKLLEQMQNSGLPEEQAVIEEARVELKREKWIKKFNDLQQAGNQPLQLSVQNQDSQISQSNPQPGSSQHVRIKTVDVLVKEFRQSEELSLDDFCQNLHTKLIVQQASCQRWLDKFNDCFNMMGHFEPKGGQSQIQELLNEGEELDLKLKEFVDLQVHQKETNEWNKTTHMIFNNSKTVTLEQLKKHIKDTIDITENGNHKLIELLDSLKETVTIWKIFAKAILKIRPIENFQHIVQANSNLEDVPHQDLFCICRQPEMANGAHMLCCDFCDMWYHYTCVGLPQDLKLDKVKYKCIGCAIREGKSSCYGGIEIAAEEGADPSDKSQVDMQQVEIENLLLSYFNQKKRIEISQFEYVINEGIQNIPLQLEEMPQLQFIAASIQRWKDKVETQLTIGPDSKQLYQNFKTINSYQLKPSQILILQQSESQRDDILSNLVIENESFPVCMPESAAIIQLCRFRDWFRQSLQLLWTFNQNLTSKNKQNKQNKIKFRKDIKRQVLKGDQILQLADAPATTQQISLVSDILNQLIQKPSVKGKDGFQINAGHDIFDQDFEKQLSPQMKPSKIITIPMSKEEVPDQNPLEEMPVQHITQQMAIEDQNVELQELGKLNYLSATLAHQHIQQVDREVDQSGQVAAEHLRGIEVEEAAAIDQQILEQTHEVRQQETATVTFAYQQHNNEFNTRAYQPQPIIHQAATVSIPLVQPPSLPQPHRQQSQQLSLQSIQQPLEQPPFLSPNQFQQANQFDQNYRGTPAYANMEKLKGLCRIIAMKYEEIDQNEHQYQQQRAETGGFQERESGAQPIDLAADAHNPVLTQWLMKTADYTNEILDHGNSRIDDAITLRFIEEGEQILHNNDQNTRRLYQNLHGSHQNI